MLGNYTSLIHGHAHPDIIAAAMVQVEKGTVFGAAGEIQFQHAEHLCNRLTSMDQVRYCNSGTEATLFAIRAARAFTGKDIFIEMDGGYYASHDAVENMLKTNVDKVAAILTEPLMGAAGTICPQPGYLEGLRTLDWPTNTT